jgi:Phage capsid family
LRAATLHGFLFAEKAACAPPSIAASGSCPHSTVPGWGSMHAPTSTSCTSAASARRPAGAIDRLFERPVYGNSYFPDLTTLTSGAQNRLVVGDFSEFVVAQRSGLSVELVPHLFGSGSRFPTGQRGFFAWGRVGSNSAFWLHNNT